MERSTQELTPEEMEAFNEWLWSQPIPKTPKKPRKYNMANRLMFKLLWGKDPSSYGRGK